MSLDEPLSLRIERVDADELRRSLWNLGTNAVKYGAKDQPVVVTLRKTGGGVAIDVNNSGAPISSEDRSREGPSAQVG